MHSDRRRFLVGATGLGAAGLLAGMEALAAQSATPARRAAAGTRKITDAAGRVVTLPLRVTRIADPWPANNAMVLMLGGADKIVATTVQAQKQPWLQKLYPRITEIAAPFNAGGDVNFETLIGARPDVVLMAYDGTPPKWLEAMTSYGVPVVLMPNTSLEGLKVTARITGDVLGERESRVAADFIRYFDANIRRVTAITGKLTASERPKVLHTASAGVLVIDGRQTVIDEWITVAGGVNAAEITGLGRPVTMEQVAAWNPDVIIVGSAPNQENRNAILQDPRWSQINAVKAQRVFANPSGAYLWDRHSAEAALQVLWAAQVLHPRRFANLDLEAETRQFYARYFKHDLTDEEFDSILNATAP